jgi:uncharacterized protein YdiU (UPF0061 family)
MSFTETSATGRLRLGFQNTYARLPERFYARLNPTPVAAPQLIRLNDAFALELNLDPEVLRSPEGVRILAGSSVAEDAEPLAIAYAGHQFGHFVPQLGDGRANLLGEVVARDNKRYDVQLKGSGPTPFSRRGDGRAALGPVLREYILSEAMAALGVPTTRALAALTTGERVVRESYLPGAVFVRVAASHLRVGTFQYFAARQDGEGLRALADFAIARHYAELAQREKPYTAFLDAVVTRQAQLVARWVSIGFIHGVMNTDNTSISGETIDYGPCAYMEDYHPGTVFSSIDQQGRYAYGNQPAAAHWNLSRLAEALLPLLELEHGSETAAIDAATASIARFENQYETARKAAFRRKLGLIRDGSDETSHEDDALVDDLLERMAAQHADFTLTFRGLCDVVEGASDDVSVRVLFADPNVYNEWAGRWRARLSLDGISASDRAAAMRQINPLYIARNHLVEEVIQSAVQRNDFQPFAQLLEIVTQPFVERPGFDRYTLPARPEEYVSHTFCGT